MKGYVVCGDERGARFYPRQRQTLCAYCAKGTPAKVSRETFEARYWEGCGEVPASTRREFWEDYLRSEHTLESYIAATVSSVL